MWIELSVPVLIAGNIIAWLVFHIGLAALATALPLRFFPPDGWICRARKREGNGQIYQTLFAVRHWKGLLPEGADMLNAGFRKGRLARRDPDYLREFYLETCRSEICHWAVWLCGWLFFLWNPLWAGWVMVGYATAANFPCIIAQRYNRLRLRRITEPRIRRGDG
jgi:glycosyl-4,4'-diaponeurosporenoate acyltransferase